MSNRKIQILLQSFQKIVEGVENYSLILLDEGGTILSWNKGVEKLKGYNAEEIIGQHFSIFYLPEDRQARLPDKLIKEAIEKGNASFVGRRIRRNGTIFWGKVDMTVIKDDNGEIIGFTKLVRELAEDTLIGHFWFDNEGILHTKANAVPQTPEAIAEFRLSLTSALAGKKVCLITDVRDAQLTPEGKLFAESGIKDIYRAIAFVSDTIVDENTIEAMKMIPEEIPARVFTSREQARRWIKQVCMI